MARYTGPDCKLCRREKTKLFLKGAKCDSPKCPIEIRPYPPGEHGRNRPKEGDYLTADPGEAEGPPDLRHPGAAVPRLLRGSGPQARPDRRDHAPAARAPPGQRRLPRGLRQEPRHGPPAGDPRPLHGERQEGRHPVLPGQRERHRRGDPQVPRDDAVRHRAGRGRRAHRAGLARGGAGQDARSWCTRCPSGRRSTPRSRNSSSSSTTRSKLSRQAGHRLRPRGPGGSTPRARMVLGGRGGQPPARSRSHIAGIAEREDQCSSLSAPRSPRSR